MHTGGVSREGRRGTGEHCTLLHLASFRHFADTRLKSRCPRLISERNRYLQRAIQVSGGSKCPLALSSSIVPEISPDESGP